MKKAFLLVILCAAIIGCDKKVNPTPPTTTTNDTPANNSSLKFIINGLTDQSLGKDSFAIWALGVAREEGTQERVTLSVTGLPENVTAEFSSASGTPDFATSLTLKATGAIPGAYPLKLLGVTASGITKSYDFNINITGTKPGEPDPILGCGQELIGDYRNDYTFKGQNKTFEYSTVESTGVKNEIKIKSAVFTKPIIATINCDTKQLTINDQKSIDWDLKNGSGYIAANGQIYINYDMVGHETIMISEVLTKK